jgi:hypothetical protein
MTTGTSRHKPIRWANSREALMSKRLLRFVVIAGFGAAGLVLWLWLTTANYRVTEEAFGELDESMTLAEVENVLGGAGLSVSPAGEVHDQMIAITGQVPKHPEARFWVAGDRVIQVVFDSDRAVQWSYYRITESWWNKIKRWLRPN